MRKIFALLVVFVMFGAFAVPVFGVVEEGGNAFIGGTMMHPEYAFPEWQTHQDQSVAFRVGEPFTVVLDAGGATYAHVHAGWGYAFVIQTDIRVANMAYVENYDAFIESIVIDGNSVSFNADAVQIAYDGGIRIALTSYWAEDDMPLAGPVYGAPDDGDIGSFSRIEVRMAITEAGEANPFGGAAAAEPEPEPADEGEDEDEPEDADDADEPEEDSEEAEDDSEEPEDVEEPEEADEPIEPVAITADISDDTPADAPVEPAPADPAPADPAPTPAPAPVADSGGGISPAVIVLILVGVAVVGGVIFFMVKKK